METKYPSQSKYYYRNKEKIKEWKRAYRIKNREKINEYKRKYRAINREAETLANRKGLLRREYKLTLQEYDNLCKQQNYLCAICMKKETLIVDHDHKTGKIRGLLCSSCNKGLGFFGDSSNLLEKSVSYLKAQGILRHLL